MRKLFFLIPAMLLSLAMNADPIGPNDPNVTVNNVIADAVAAAYEEGIGLEDLIRKALKVAAGKKFS